MTKPMCSVKTVVKGVIVHCDWPEGHDGMHVGRLVTSVRWWGGEGRASFNQPRHTAP